jgi:hypothetical protein
MTINDGGDDGPTSPVQAVNAPMPDSYAAELRAAFPNITEAGIASYWRARHLPTD